jgi:GT2 family glycosyltransferase
MVLVSVVVLNYNGARFLQQALESLAELDYDSYEVVVVDNGSEDESLEVAGRFDARVIETGRNLGFSKANNLGAAEAKGDFILFVNNDMRFDRSLLSAMVEVIRSDDGIFAVDCRQLDWDGHRPIHGARRFRPGSPIEPFWPFLKEVQKFDVGGPVDTPWGCGSNLMVRRWMFHSLGGFDPTFFLDYEDLDLCWRAWLRGWRSVFVPHTKTYHFVGGDTADVASRSVHWRALSGERNVERFFLKTMPKKMLLQVAFGRVLRAIAALILLRPTYVTILFLSSLSTLRSLPEILIQRREILESAKLSSEDIIARFWSSDF